MPRRILLVDLSARLRSSIRACLRDAGDVVECAAGATQARRLAQEGDFDLILLEGRSSSRHGRIVPFDACLQPGSPPVLLLTEGRTADILEGLRMGADDYVTSPDNVQELMTRIDVLCQNEPHRNGGSGIGQYEFGSVRVDVLGTQATRKGCKVGLFAREFRLLQHFVENPGVTFSRQELLSAVWEKEHYPTRTVDVHVASLRRKLEPHPRRPRHFLTLRGFGYKFQP